MRFSIVLTHKNGGLMTLKECEEYFGSKYQIAKQCGISKSVPYDWRNKGFIPINAQIKIERITKGALKASIEDLKV